MRNHILGVTTIFLVALVMMPAQASSHREAPLLAQDPWRTTPTSTRLCRLTIPTR